MALDPSISLQVKPVEMASPDIAKTLLSVAQIKYLDTEGTRAQAQADLLRTQGAAAREDFEQSQRVRAEGRRLAPQLMPESNGLVPLSPDMTVAPGSLVPTPGVPSGAGLPPTGVVPPGPAAPPGPGGGPPPGLPSAPPGGLPAAAPPPPPAAGGPPAPARPRMDTATYVQHLIAVDAKMGAEYGAKLFDLDKQGLENSGRQLEQTKGRLALVAQFLKDVKDQPGLDLALSLMAHNGANIAGIPKTFTPQLPAMLANSTRTAQQQVEQLQKDLELKTAQQDAQSRSVLAQAETVKAGAAQQQAATGAKAQEFEAHRPQPMTGLVGETILVDPSTHLPIDVTRGQGSPPGAPGAVPSVPGTGRPMTEGETKVKGQLDMAAASNGRLALLEAQMASAGGGLSAIAPGYAAHLATAYGGATGHAALEAKRRQYQDEAQNFVTAVRDEQSARGLTPITEQYGHTRFFPVVGDTEADILRKRQLREEELGAMQTRTNRPLGFVPAGQRPAAAGNAPPKANLPPPPAGATVTPTNGVSMKEIRDTVALANKQGRKTPSGDPFTVDYLTNYLKDQKITVTP